MTSDKVIKEYINCMNEIFRENAENYGECFEQCEISENGNHVQVIMRIDDKIITTKIVTTIESFVKNLSPSDKKK
jgi:hypothetical protein